jgi:hypothetical protein
MTPDASPARNGENAARRPRPDGIELDQRVRSAGEVVVTVSGHLG